MDIKPILGYYELTYMLMVGHEYVPEKKVFGHSISCPLSQKEPFEAPKILISLKRRIVFCYH